MKTARIFAFASFAMIFACGSALAEDYISERDPMEILSAAKQFNDTLRSAGIAGLIGAISQCYSSASVSVPTHGRSDARHVY